MASKFAARFDGMLRQMVALNKVEQQWEWPEATPIDRSKSAFLNHLRFTALGCRAKSRTDLFEACALLTLDRTLSLAAHADALMRCLDQALGQRAILFRPGTSEQSFDEAWLLQLATALCRKDEASTTFLLHSRIDRQHHRHIRFLLAHISEHFSLI